MSSLSRILEPEIMKDYEQCNQYYRAMRDPIFEIVIKNLPKLVGEVADLGCGPGELLKILQKKYLDIKIDGYDGSETMLNIAKRYLKGLDRINLIHLNFENIQKKYDTIISVNTLHHIHDPNKFWKTVKRISKENANIFVLDLIRPNCLSDVYDILEETIIYKDDIIFKEDYRNSLMAAFTPEEILKQIEGSNLNLKVISLLGTNLKLAMIKNYG